jgi:hypothetical protein
MSLHVQLDDGPQNPTPVFLLKSTRRSTDGITQDEFANRRAGKPYVIHEDEFTNDNLPQHSVTTYTYYQVDGVLADEDGSRLTDVQETVGNALNRFGHGTGDPNVVFVRNDALQLQIEITRLPNESYEQSVEGLQHDKA